MKIEPVGEKVTSLRSQQKAFTRARIIETGKKLFGEVGFHNTTIDQIVSAMGTSRQTFYKHFADKEAVLTEIVNEYIPRAIEQIASLPAPQPSWEEVVQWVEDWTAFVHRERGSIALLMEVGAFAPIRPIAVRSTMDRIVEDLGQRIPAFAAAMRDDALGFAAKAYAELVMSALTHAARIVQQNEGERYVRATITTVAEVAFRFLNDPRFGPSC